jgi:hypothetical protein
LPECIPIPPECYFHPKAKSQVYLLLDDTNWWGFGEDLR